MFCFANTPFCITGYDTTSYPANIGKVRPFQKLIEKQAFHLLENLGSHINSYKDVEHEKRFYHTIMYPGLPGESITETRVRMYQKKKIKTSSTPISDEESIAQHLKRRDLQCFIWKQCMKQNMIIPKPEGRGWYMKDRIILPVWYVGEQLPPSLTKRKTR